MHENGRMVPWYFCTCMLAVHVYVSCTTYVSFILFYSCTAYFYLSFPERHSQKFWETFSLLRFSLPKMAQLLFSVHAVAPLYKFHPTAYVHVSSRNPS